jgi:hypothetical protein
VGGRPIAGRLVTEGEIEGAGVAVGAGLEAMAEGIGVAVSAEEIPPMKTNPITKAANKIPPINKNTSKIITSPETPAGGDGTRPELFAINTRNLFDSILQSFCQ